MLSFGNPAAFALSIAEQVEAAGYKLKNVETTRTPQNSVPVEDTEIAKSLLKLLDSIENHDDVQNVYSNFEIDDSLLEQIS